MIQAVPWVVCAARAQAGKPREGQLQALWWCMTHGYLRQMLSAKLGVVMGDLDDQIPNSLNPNVSQGYLLQMLSAKLGVVTGKNLAQQCRHGWKLLLISQSCVFRPEWQPLCCSENDCQAMARTRCDRQHAPCAC